MNRKVDFWCGVCIALLAVCTACFSLIYVKSHHAVCFSLAITCGTFTYHTAMRFAMGWVVGRHRVPVNPQGRWFRPHPWEPGLYAHLGVKRWKHRVPSYKPYDMHGDLQAVVMQMCRNELAHEVMATLSFVPLLFCLFCDDPVANLPVFLITSVLAAVAAPRAKGGEKIKNFTADTFCSLSYFLFWQLVIPRTNYPKTKTFYLKNNRPMWAKRKKNTGAL